MFSIVIPVHGQAEYIATALESVKAQDVPAELAVLDATGDDSVQRVLSGYRGMISYGYHRPDNGQAAAIQEGWDNTGGDIVAWLNADDYLFPGALAQAQAVFDSDPAADMVFGHGVYVYPDCGFMMYFPSINPDISRITRGCMVHQPSCFVRRAAMEKVGGLNTALQYTMDWDFWLRLHQAGRLFRFLDKPLSAARIYPATKTLRGSEKRYQEMRQILAPNAGRAYRLAFALKYRAYDMMNQESGLMGRAVSYAGGATLALKQKLFPAQPIYGLERWTNMVRDRCEVYIPWFNPAPPREVAAEITGNQDIAIALNGAPLAVRNAGRSPDARFIGQKVDAVAVVAPLPEVRGNILRFTLKAQGGKFRLVSLRAR
jgi:glycosyltransferase involved in cell wall biosynthesis